MFYYLTLRSYEMLRNVEIDNFKKNTDAFEISLIRLPFKRPLNEDCATGIQDKIQATAKNGVTSFEQLAQALPRVSGSAAAC